MSSDRAKREYRYRRFGLGYDLLSVGLLSSALKSGAENTSPERHMDQHMVQPIAFPSAGLELLWTGQYADAKIRANGKTYNVHKVVLCSRSPWFRAALEGGFAEGQSSIIDISAPDNIERLLEFIYTGAVDLRDDAHISNLMVAANELFVLGDFYRVEEMQAYATKILGQHLGGYLNAICSMDPSADLPPQFGPRDTHRGNFHSNITLLHETRFNSLKRLGFVDRLCAAIRDAYDTPSGVHNIYVDFVYAARIHTFKSEEIRALKDELPRFGADVLSALMTGPRSSAFQGNTAFEQWKDGLSNPAELLECSGRPGADSPPPREARPHPHPHIRLHSHPHIRPHRMPPPGDN
ncbi:hypothetical protein Daus18300_005700 [Diaporthe australafricana]|uniref:BTB domain-containing protein n=1 Tax=Diaporthe australafricana TaxID=127596 RepID=A0ABR3WZN3_9PEZI